MKSVWRLTGGDQGGAIFLLALVLVAIMSLLGIALFDLSRIEGALATSDIVSSQVLSCAEAGLGRSMLDYYAGGATTGQVNSVLGTSSSVTLTSPPVTTALPGAPSCTYTVIFTGLTTCNPLATCGRLQATAAANGVTRSVRIQLLNLSFRTWSTPSDTYTDTSDVGGSTTNPYFSHTGGSAFDGDHVNVGYYITNSGPNFPGFLSAYPVNGVNGLPGPGTPLPYWGKSDGTFDRNFFFVSNGGTRKVTFQWGKSANVGGGTTDPDIFGWFETNSTGTTLVALHPIVTANGGSQFQPGTDYSFTPTQYYGFYMSSSRGTFTTLASLGTDNPGAWGPIPPAQNGVAVAGNSITHGPPLCGSTQCFSIPLQHFSVFRQSVTTSWIGVEDLYNLGPKRGYGGCTAPGTSGPFPQCYKRSDIDQDYQDMIFKFSASNGDTMLSGGSGVTVDPRSWKDWQECSGPGTPPSC